MKNLLIVESPGKIKTISKLLGKNFIVLSTVGHIKDLPKKKIGVTFNGGIDIQYVTLEGKEKTIAEICKAASTADVIFLATDQDREGEIIAWHVEQEVERVVKNKKNIHRITYNEITKSAIEYAIAHPSIVDENKVSAQQARRVLDRLVGYEVSPILWKKIAKGLSAGRVQSVALKMIVDREKDIRAFKQEEYWSIESLFNGKSGSFTAPLVQVNKKKPTIGTDKAAQTLIEKIKKEEYAVESIKESERLKNPLPPYMTSTLQQAAYNTLRFSVSKTMSVAQKLYEGIPLQDKSTPVALITYMRTDSLRISETGLKEARSYIQKVLGKEYLPSSARVYSKSKAQDAHEAIRPIDTSLTPDKVKAYLPAEAAKLYDLIWRRFVASQMNPAKYAQKQVTVTGGPYVFKVTGSTLLFDGYLKVYSSEEEKDDEKVTIPKNLAEQESLKIKELTPKQHFTQPPPRFTEATLVKELEKEGIGRPSTYATIMKTIQERSYTEKDDSKRFMPTELGMVVTQMLTENLPLIMDLKFTAKMEESLDKVAGGTLERDKLLRDFYTDFEKDLTTFKGEAKKVIEETGISCPECKTGQLIVRFGKAGPFAGCNRYPECKFTSNFKRLADGSISLVEAEAPKVLEENCPQCGNPLRQMTGRFGPFIACTGYPKCRYIKPTTANFKCPLCNKGDVVQKMWKGKKFWGCSTYPACKFSISGEIEQRPCPDCKTPYLLRRIDKTGQVTLKCANKECGYTTTEQAE